MLPGIRGSLVAGAFIESTLLPELEAATTSEHVVSARRMRRWWTRAAGSLGPASGARAVLDVGALALIDALGFTVGRLEPHGDGFVGLLRGRSSALVASLRTTRWNGSADSAWRDAVRAGRVSGARWGLIYTGPALRLVDASHTWSRRSLDFDLGMVAADERSLTIFCSLVGALARQSDDGKSVLAAVIERSDAYAHGVCASLSDGVLEAIANLVREFEREGRRLRPPPARSAVFMQSLTVVYRLLFLLFAEARDLVPTWHRVYRDAYTMDALCRRALERPAGRGSWATVQAISRLAHAGCRAGDLEVTAFNGRLFSPSDTPLATRARVPDDVVARAIVALATAAGPHGRRRIAYADLGVEQLGAVYERVLEYEPAAGPSGAQTRRRGRASPVDRDRRRGPAPVLARTSTERKATGAFYTPRAVTEFLVRRALHPLVENRSAAAILDLRIVDPAMGSGAFLVAACRYLAAAMERALVRAGEWSEDDAAGRRRAELRRLVAQRCLYGVDRNPVAVQLTRLSLWLATLAGDRPLTFLDHHLAVGDSLVGATLSDLARAPGARGARDRPLPLFPDAMSRAMSERVLPDRYRLALEPDDSAGVVRAKERRLDALSAPGTLLHLWRTAADLWCAAWFQGGSLPPAVYRDLLSSLIDGRGALTGRHRRTFIESAAAHARSERFFHWELAFPEVFFDDTGRRDPAGGFDAVVGNPPWETLRADTGGPDARRTTRVAMRARHRFFRDAGVYRLRGAGHTNSYQLFVERSLRLARPGGRLALVLPSGIAIDHGCGPLRRELLDRTRIDRLLGFDNRAGIFPIHRDMKFLLLEAMAGGVTERVACSLGHTHADWLDALPDAAADDPPAARPLSIARSLLEAMDPASLALPLVTAPIDLEILAGVTASTPPLAAPHGWAVTFGRELNASDDRDLFVPASSTPGLLPVVEGKHLEPFRTLVSASRTAIAGSAAARLLHSRRQLAQRRIGYRNVASATNRTTLIAAVIPGGVVTTHTIFCSRETLDDDDLYCLLALLNSLAANYLVRLQVSTHVPAALMARLPVPRPSHDDPRFAELGHLARTLERRGAEDGQAALVRLNAIAASLYGLTPRQYRHVIGTFPLLPDALRAACARDCTQESETSAPTAT